MPGGRFEAAIRAIDEANAGDPNRLVVGGREHPKEVVHAERMTDWVRRLDPGADELQLLAARAHHLRRWAVPRSSYPEGREGYLRWRRDLGRRHAEEVAVILEACGYEAGEIERVQQIVRKERLRSDPAVQTHEDARCLVFLELQLGELGGRLGDDRTVAVLRKTLAKMSERGVAEARQLELDPAGRALVERALAPG